MENQHYRVRSCAARRRVCRAAVGAALAFGAVAAHAETDSGDTAWVMASTAVVLFMTIPGLALFYGGLVRSTGVLSVLMQCFALTCLVSVLWLAVGYSLAFGGTAPFIGDFSRVFFVGMGFEGSIPENTFALFQLMFAIITPALVVGAFAERMRFSAVLVFGALWSLAVYAPVAHWVWGGAGSPSSGFWTSRAERWCTSRPASPPWSRRWWSAPGAGTRTRSRRRTT